MQLLRLREIMGPIDSKDVRDGNERSPRGLPERERKERVGRFSSERSFNDWREKRFWERSKEDKLDKVGSNDTGWVIAVSDSLHLVR